MSTTSNFDFIRAEWPGLYDPASRAESCVYSDPRVACFYARHALEYAVKWVFKFDAALRLPYQDNLSALIHEPTFRAAAGEAVFNKARLIKDLGNGAVHSHRPVLDRDAIQAVKELFHVAFWLASTYARRTEVPAGLLFDPNLIPKAVPATPRTLEQIQRAEAKLREREENLANVLDERKPLDEQLVLLREEIAEAKKANAARPTDHDYSEKETRDYFIDLLLKEAGWALDGKNDREYEVEGMPGTTGKGFVDYVLWGDDGRPLALVEAKRTRRDPNAGKEQAKRYADCLEKRFGRRPVIFYSNGYDHWLWDKEDLNGAPRQVQGFYTKDELELMIRRRTERGSLLATPVNGEIVDRYYQERAIRSVAEAFETHELRKALIVMATGAGKTRTVIALCDLLISAGWAKRVLFLADRVALVKQAVNAFKKFLPDASPVNLIEPKGDEEEGRVYVSTYPTMMRLIDERDGGKRRFGVGHFDLIVIDEAHRSVYRKYKAIFDYFDARLVGLTATPKEEIDRNTYTFFALESGVPTDVYSLEDAIADGFLVPPIPIAVPLKFQTEGITYDDLSEEDKEAWDAAEWTGEGEIPDRVDAAALNRWLFNADTVDKVLEHLMRRGQKVAGGDRLGKTIIFAKNHDHAEFIVRRFDANYPHLRGEFARVIDFTVKFAQDLLEDFCEPEKPPQIAVSVDMLDTGVDVKEAVNLVFFKSVRSRTKFWQMIGRGTRLCPDLFGPGEDKKFFYIFDYCGNLEFFGANLATAEGTVSEPLSQRLFRKRLELIAALDRNASAGGGLHVGEPGAPYAAVDGAGGENAMLRNEIAETLRTYVAAMNVDNFIVRPKRLFVERYANADAWKEIGPDAIGELITELSGLPTELDPEHEEVKRFDVLMFGLQLAVLNRAKRVDGLRDRVKKIAELLEEKESIPMIREQLPLIQEIQSDEWWQDVTLPMLENARKRLRLLVPLIDKRDRKVVYTDFEDEMGEETPYAFPGFATPDSFERFREKARHYLRAHENHLAIHKLRMNEPLTPTDLSELERMLVESGTGTAENVERAKEESHGLGLFVRSLVGLDREAAKRAFAAFLSDKTLSAQQINFVNMMVEHLTQHGVMTLGRLYGSPYTDISPRGLEGIFSEPQIHQLVTVLHDVRARAAA